MAVRPETFTCKLRTVGVLACDKLFAGRKYTWSNTISCGRFSVHVTPQCVVL